MTWGLLRISSGVPFGDDAAKVQHGDALADAHDEAHIMLDEQDSDVELVADAADGLRQLCGLGGFMPAAGSSRSSSFGLVASARMISRRRCAP